MATDNNGFQIVGPKQISAPVLLEQTKHRLPSVSFAILGIIVIGCLLANVKGSLIYGFDELHKGAESGVFI